MALPVTITGLATGVTPVGPFKSTGGVAFNDITRANGSTGATGIGVTTGGAERVGQSIIVPAGGITCSSVVFRMYKSGSPTDQTVCQIFAVDANHFPTGSPIATCDVNLNSSTLSTSVSSPTTVTFTFTNAVLAGSTEYSFVLSRTGANDNANASLRVSAVTAADTHGGYETRYTAGAWSAFAQDAPLTVNSSTPCYYFFGKDSVAAGIIRAYKTTDPTVAFSVVASQNLTGSGPGAMSAYQVGNVIHLLCGQLVSTNIGYQYDQFNMATDTFGTSEQIITPIITTGQTGAAQYGCSLVVRSNGEVVALFNGVQTKTSGTFYARVYYSRRTAVNVWSAGVQVDGNTASDFTVPEAILSANSDAVEFIWRNNQGAISNQRLLSAANVLGTAANLVNTLSYQGVGYLNGAVTRFVAAGQGLTVAFDQGLTVTQAGVALTNALLPVRPFVDGTDVIVLYPKADGDLWFRKTIDHGVTWQAETAATFVGTVASVEANLSKDATIYQRGNAVVIPYVVNDNGTWKYNEHVVRYIAQADAWNINDKFNITLSNSDKTASVTGTLAGVRSTKTRLNGAAGLFYAELVAGATPPAYLGLAALSSSLTGVNNSFFVDTGSGGIYYVAQGQIGSVGSAVVANDVVCVVWNTGTEQVWFRKNGGNWNDSGSANPALGIGGISVSQAPAENHALWMSTGSSGNVGSATIRTKIADFTYTAPAGAQSWMGEVIPVADAWNAADKNANVTLTNGDKTADANGATYGVRSTQTQNSGKYYAEFVYGVSSSSQPIIGFKDISAALNTFSANSFSVMSSGGLYWYLNGVQTGGSIHNPNINAGDVLSLAWDTNIDRAWARINAEGWTGSGAQGAGDPATGLNGLDVSSIAGTNFALWFLSNGPGKPLTIRTEKAEFTQTTPAGYTSWMGETLVVPDMGTLAAGTATVAGVGAVTHIGSGVLTAQNSGLVSNFALSSSTGTGALTAVNVRTNRLPWSQDIDQWTKFLAPVAPNAGVLAPDGTYTADRVSDTVDNSQHGVIQYTSLPASGDYTFSAYFQKGTLDWVQLYFNDGTNHYAANFNIGTGVKGWCHPSATSSIVAVGSGWYRCSLSAPQVLSGPTVNVFIYTANGDAVVYGQTYSGTGSTFLLWGAQLEPGSVAGAYIPTNNVAVSIGPLVGTGTASWNATGALIAGTLRTNFTKWSQALNNAAWNNSGITVAADSSLALDGSTTAETLTTTAVSTGHYLYQDGPFALVDGVYVQSVYVKPIAGTWFTLMDAYSGVGACFNVVTGAKGVAGSVVGYDIIPMGDGWYRCWISINRLAGQQLGQQVSLPNGNSVGANHGVGGLSFLVWGAQYELGTVPTAYIATTSAPVTVGGTPPSITGSGQVTSPPVTGTGTLTTAVAALASFGGVYSSGIGALTAANNVLAGVGIGGVTGTGVLTTVAVASGVGISSSRSTSGILNSSAVDLVSAGFSRSLGTAVLTPTVSTAVGLGVTGNFGTGTLAPAASVIVGVASSRWNATGTLVAQASGLPGVAVSSSVGTGALPLLTVSTISSTGGLSTSFGTATLTTTDAAMAGSGAALSGVAGPGILQPLNSTITSTGGLSRSFGTAALINPAMVIVAPGVGQSSGLGTLPSAVASLIGVGAVGSVGTGALITTATLAGSGTSRWIASGSIPAGVATITSVGVVRWSGTGTLPANVATITATGLSSSSATATLQASVAALSAFEGVTIISGTGTLLAQSCVVNGIGVSRSLGTSVLTNSVAALSGVGISRTFGTGILTGQYPTITGIGNSLGTGTGALVAPVSIVYGAEGISIISGLGVLQPSASTTIGIGGMGWGGTGNIVANNSTVNGLGALITTGTGALVAVNATITSGGASGYLGTGALDARTASIIGFGVNGWSAIGTLAATASTITAAGIRTWNATGTINANVATVTGVGLSGSIGTAPLQSASANVFGSEGTVVILGTGTLVARSSNVNAVNPISGSVGTGVLVNGTTDVAGLGFARYQGVGVLLSLRADITGIGSSTFVATGDLNAQTRRIFGYGFVSTVANGILDAGTSSIEGTGVVGYQGTGVLAPARSIVTGAGVSITFGTSALVAAVSVVYGRDVALAIGAGNLISGSAIIVGGGEGTQAWPTTPTALPGSYPGTTTWQNPGTAMWQNTGGNPWWIKAA
jgi:hypothetical protein